MPFCTHRCDYCAFATWTDRAHLVGDYVAAVATEASRAVAAGMPAADTVFFGGGTPSLLEPPALAVLLDAVPRRPGAEVTVECNPETVDEGRLAGYREAGVTRLSFGVQSMLPRVLDALGRRHDPASVHRAVAAAASAGFGDRYSVDLIFGAAGETVADWSRTLEEVLALDPPPAHVSAYGLTVEAGTPLARTPERHPDGDDQADKYGLADERLAAAGLQWYELSNWARPGAECRHNRVYWSQGDYRGLGCAAHSHARRADGGARRWWNVRTPERYLRHVAEGISPEAAGEDLDPATRRREAALLGLRTREGVAVAELPEPAALAAVLDAGLAEVVPGPGVGAVGAVAAAGGRVRLTLRGRLLANEVAVRLCA